MNRTLVVDAIREHGPLARADLVRLTSISPAAVSAIVDELVQEGVLRESGERSSDGGRRARLLTFGDGVCYAGCDLSEAGVACVGLMDMHGRLSDPVAVAYRATDPKEVAAAIAAHLRTRARRSGAGVLRGIGVGVPGFIDVASGVVRWAPGLDWEDVAFAEILSSRLGVPVFVDNDVNLALVAEVELGAAAGAEHAMLVVFADGVGGAVVADRRLYRGRGGGGEVGYLVTDARGARGDFRAFGVTERRIFESLAGECRSRGLALDGHEAQTAALARLLAEPDGSLRLSRRARRDLVATVGGALASASALLDPEVIVLGGWVARLGAEFLTELETTIARLSPNVPALRFSEVEPPPVVAGAALTARRVAFESVHVVRGAV